MLLAALLISTTLIWFQQGWLPALLLGLLAALFIAKFSVKPFFTYLICIFIILAGLEIQITHKLPQTYQHQEVELTLCFEQVPKRFSDDYSSVIAQVIVQPKDLKLRKVKLAAYKGELDGFINKADVCSQVVVRLRQPLGRIIPNAFNADAHYVANNIDALASLVSMSESTQALGVSGFLYQNIKQKLADENAIAIWTALVLGWSASMPEGVKHTLAANQLMHLFVISGMHFSFIAFFVGGLIHLLARLSAPIWVMGMVTQSTLVIAILLAYLALIGFPVPAVRAFVMLLIPIFCLGAQIKISLWKALGLAVIVLTLWQPQMWLAASAWLSFISVAVIVMVFKWHWVDRHRFWKTLLGVQGSMLCLSILWSTVFAFNLNILSFFIVTAVTPMVLLLLMPLAVLLAIHPHNIFISIFEVLIHYLFVLLNKFQPLALVLPAQGWLILVPILILTLLLLRFRDGWFVVAALLWVPIFVVGGFGFFASNTKANHGELTIYDVGHGQAVLIKTPEGHFLLDTGGRFSEEFSIYEQTLAHILPKLEGIIISHADRDHSAGVRAIRAKYPEIKIWSGQQAELSVGHTLLNCHKSMPINDYLRFIPIPQYMQNTRNNHSCILVFELGEFSAVLTSDADKFIEYYLLQRHSELLPADLILLGHHGSDSSSASQWLEVHKNSQILVSNSNRSAPIWPSQRIRRWLNNQQVPLLQTAELGSIRIRIRTDQILLKTWDSDYRNRLLH